MGYPHKFFHDIFLIQVLSHFTKHVLSSNDRTMLDDELASFIVGFIVDHHFEIFKVPTLLQLNISAAICQLDESTVCKLLGILCLVWKF